MTDQDAMLKLAWIAYPTAQNVWRDESSLKWYVHEDCGAITQFDPANNDTQAVAVLLWMLGRIRTVITHDEIVCWHSNDILLCEYEYDRTPASFRAAVTKAALRVVGGST